MTSLLPIRLWKEVRELGPAWLIAVAAILAATLPTVMEEDLSAVARDALAMRALAMPAYALGALILAALSMGHEYSNGTLAQLLVQPGTRSATLFRKLGALGALLLPLTALAWLVLSDLPPRFLLAPLDVGLGVPLLCSLFLVPCLTLITRNALAGIVFTVAAVATLLLISDFVATLRYGHDVWATLPEPSSLTSPVDSLKSELFWLGMLLASAAAAAVSVRKFLRLEVVDGRGVELHLPARLFPTAALRSSEAHTVGVAHPRRLLVAKELRLQQLTFVVSGLYLVASLMLAYLPENLPPYGRTELLRAFTWLHFFAIPFLAGSLASAEERQLGTLGAQMLLPIAAWRQWLLKVGIVLALSVGLALGLPALLFGFANGTQVFESLSPYYGSSFTMAIAAGQSTAFAATVFVLAASLVSAIAALTLYVSSLNTSVMRALVGSLAAVASTALGAALFVESRFWLSRNYASYVRSPNEAWLMDSALPILWAATGIVVLLWLGMRNHRSAERSSSLARKQAAWIAAGIAVSIGAMASYQAVRNQQGLRAYRELYGNIDFVIEAQSVAPSDVTVVVFYSSDRGESRYLLMPSIGGWRNLLPADRNLVATAVWHEGLASRDFRRDIRSDPTLREELRSAAIALPRPSWPTTTVTLEPIRLPR